MSQLIESVLSVLHHIQDSDIQGEFTAIPAAKSRVFWSLRNRTKVHTLLHVQIQQENDYMCEEYWTSAFFHLIIHVHGNISLHPLLK